MSFLTFLRWELRRLWYLPRFRHLGKRVQIGDIKVINGSRRKGIILGDECVVKDGTVLITDTEMKESYIRMEKGSGFNRNCYVGGEGGVRIGAYAQIGPHVCIISANHGFHDRHRRIKDHPVEAGEVDIGEDVWIGANAVVLPGVKIGKGSVIGAGAVVSKDIPEYSVAVGVPAKVIKKR